LFQDNSVRCWKKQRSLDTDSKDALFLSGVHVAPFRTAVPTYSGVSCSAACLLWRPGLCHITGSRFSAVLGLSSPPHTLTHGPCGHREKCRSLIDSLSPRGVPYQGLGPWSRSPFPSLPAVPQPAPLVNHNVRATDPPGHLPGLILRSS
jgi:hypothetical protein